MKRIRRRRNRYATEISMINLIDVIFMLLIFFMLTMTFKTVSKFDLSLPKSSQKFSDDLNKTVEIFYEYNGHVGIKTDKKGELILDSFDELAKHIKSLDGYEKKIVNLSADERLDYGKIIDLITVLKENKIEKIQLNIEKE